MDSFQTFATRVAESKNISAAIRFVYFNFLYIFWRTKRARIFGAIAVSGGGDVNGDGLSDVPDLNTCLPKTSEAYFCLARY